MGVRLGRLTAYSRLQVGCSRRAVASPREARLPRSQRTRVCPQIDILTLSQPACQSAASDPAIAAKCLDRIPHPFGDALDAFVFRQAVRELPERRGNSGRSPSMRLRHVAWRQFHSGSYAGRPSPRYPARSSQGDIGEYGLAPHHEVTLAPCERSGRPLCTRRLLRAPNMTSLTLGLAARA